MEAEPLEEKEEGGPVVVTTPVLDAPKEKEDVEEDVQVDEEEEEEEEDGEANHSVDLILKHLDEVDPCHRLRSLCKKGDTNELRELLNSDEEVDIDTVSAEGWTCLHEIITHDCQFTEIARILIQHGANVNTQDLHGDSPLHSSLLYHNSENIQLLLKHGADIELVNASGRRPIHCANDSESLELLLKYGAQIDARDHLGNTALHYAVVAKDMDRVKLLISHNCDLTCPNDAGSSPLHLVSDTEMAKVLLDADTSGQAVNILDKSGNSPLHVAVRGRHKETVRLLLDRKGRTDLVNGNGKSPINFAKDKEMKNILLGKEPTVVSKKPKPKTTSSSPAPNGTSLSHLPLVTEPVTKSPSILKRKRTSSCDTVKPKGPRLRFSEVNDYSGVEVVETTERRVKIPPIYSELQFSSDED